MKKIFGKLLLASCALAGVAALFSSCKRTPDDLTLYGVWEEKHYTVYDTNMASFSQHRLELDCPGSYTDSLGNPFKGGEFTLYIKSTHKPSLSSYLSGRDSTFVYTEYVKGQYRVNDSRSLLDFNGKYYVDSLFSTEANSSNTEYEYAFGAFQRNATYKLNDEFLILQFNDSLSSSNGLSVDLNHFKPVGARYNCF